MFLLLRAKSPLHAYMYAYTSVYIYMFVYVCDQISFNYLI